MTVSVRDALAATIAIKSRLSGGEHVVAHDIETLPPLVAGDANIGNVDVLTLPALPEGPNAIGLVGADNAVDPAWGTGLDSSQTQTVTLSAAQIGKMNEVWLRFELLDLGAPDGKLHCEGSVDGVNWDPILRPDLATVTAVLAGVVSAAGTLPAGVTLTGNVFDVVAATVAGTLLLVIPFDSPPPGGVRLRWVPELSSGAAAGINVSNGRRAA